MDAITDLLASISNSTSSLIPITLPLPTLPLSLTNLTTPYLPYLPDLPLASVSHLAELLQHLTSTHVHPVYFPYLRFGAVHAARVTTVWAVMTKNRKNEAAQAGAGAARVGLLQDLVGYLTLAWGGGTLVSLLLSEPPSWLISPTPWIIYPSIYLLLIPTGLSSFIVSTFPTSLLNLIMSYVDGTTRGVSLSALPAAIGASRLAGSGAWTHALLSGIAVCGGGWLTQGFGLHKASWTLGRPAVLDGGVLGTLDLWGGMLVGLLYSVLTRSLPDLAGVSDTVLSFLPSEIHALNTAGKLDKATPAAALNSDTARAICVLVLGSLLAARVLTTSVLAFVKGVVRDEKAEAKAEAVGGGKKRKSTKKIEEQPVVAVGGEKDTVIKTPASKGVSTPRERKSTPRKSPKPK